MKITLVLLPIGAMTNWLNKNEHRIKSFQKGTQKGEFSNGVRFRVIMPDNNRQWLDTIRGIYIGEIEKDRDVMISPDHYCALQSMMNRG